jgi:ABC-type antimicrobial peptide transport system permease subunit
MRTRGPNAVYLAYFQQRYNQPLVLVRTMGDPSALATSVRRQIEALGREYPLRMTTLVHEVDRLLLPERLMAMLSGCFGALSLLLASIGLYGLMANLSTRRTAEIGIRIALGAQPKTILWLGVRETLFLVVTGVAIGLLIALMTSRLISSQLYGLTPTDPMTITMAALLLVVVAAFAGYLPARRASRVDPIVALRYE